MHLRFARHGRQFFFLTICVSGRLAVLSRLADEAQRPALTRAGECVKALWLAIHGLNPALTAGEFAIMPDHVHLLLIVDYDRDPAFRPLVFLHWFMEESERMMAAAGAATDGGAAPEPPNAEAASKAAAPIPRATAPDLAALLPTSIRNTYHPQSRHPSSPSLGSVAAPALSRQPPFPHASHSTAPIGGSGAAPAADAHAIARGSGAAPPSVAAPQVRWDRRFWLDLSFDARQLAAIRRYIRGNPARAIWKRRHPDRFLCHANLRHRILDPAFPWSACGDLTLLASPFLLAVSLTRRKSLAEHEPEIAALVEKARRGWVIVCGFLSPGEKELARRLREEPRARWIKTLAHGLPPRYDPSLADSRELAAGRALLLSALPCNAPFDWNTCHRMNDLAAAMCRRARGECE